MGKYANPDGGFKSKYEDIVYIKDVPNVNDRFSTDLIELHKHIKNQFVQGATQPVEPSSDIINMQSGSVNWNSDDIKRWKGGEEQTTATTIAVNMMKQMDANLLTSTGLYAEDKARHIINMSDKIATNFEHYETLSGPATYNGNNQLVLYNILKDVQQRTADLSSLSGTASSSAAVLGFSSGVEPDLTISKASSALDRYNDNLVSLQSDFRTARDNLLHNNTNSYTNLVNALKNLQTDQNEKLHELQKDADEFERNINNVKNKITSMIGVASDHNSSDFLTNTYKSTFHGIIARGNKNINTIFNEIQKLDKDLQVREDQLNKETVKMECWLLRQQGYGTEGMPPLPAHCLTEYDELDE